MATSEFSKFANILSAALHHLLGFEIPQLEFRHLQELSSLYVYYLR